MNSAVITPCSHFFHAGCLKKWLYVQETCPLCHSQLKSQTPTTAGSSQDTPAANQSPAGQDEAPANGNGEGDGKTVTPAGETSGVSPSPQEQTTSSSSDPCPSTLVKESRSQSPSSHRHHHLSSPVNVTPAELDPSSQTSSGILSDSQRSPTALTSDQLLPFSGEPCPPASLWTMVLHRSYMLIKAQSTHSICQSCSKNSKPFSKSSQRKRNHRTQTKKWRNV